MARAESYTPQMSLFPVGHPDRMPPIAAVDIVKNHLIAKHGIKGKYRSLYSAVYVILQEDAA
jgi:hypothetical protein